MKHLLITLTLTLASVFAFSQTKPVAAVDSSFTVKLEPKQIREISRILQVTQATITSSNTPVSQALPLVQQLEYLNQFIISLQPKSAPKK